MARSDQATTTSQDPTAWEDQYGHVHDSEELWNLVFEQNALIHESIERIDALEDALRLVHRVLAQTVAPTG
ncbi:MAG: hypothetical protein M3P85_13845 [Actinomycetota bacterium]|nr:hypothetical protein [Actinomycetota bacterium]